MQAITALFFFYFDRKSEHFCDDTLSGKMPDELTMIKNHEHLPYAIHFIKIK